MCSFLELNIFEWGSTKFVTLKGERNHRAEASSDTLQFIIYGRSS